MDPIAALEKEKYEKIWDKSVYRACSPGFNFSKLFLNWIKPLSKEGQRIIDYGSGPGRTCLPFLNEGYGVDMVDIAENSLDESVQNLLPLFPSRLTFTCASLWNLPNALKPADWFYCCDVLEHLPTSKIDTTFEEMSKRTLTGGLLQIFLEDDELGSLVDEQLHLTLQTASWWISRIAQYWPIWHITHPVKHFKRLTCLVGQGYLKI